MNEKLKQIERNIENFVDIVVKNQVNEITPRIEKFMNKREEDIASLLRIQALIQKACDVWDEDIVNLVISTLSLTKYHGYTFLFNKSTMSFSFYDDLETLDLTVDIRFSFNELTKNIKIEITWLEDTENTLVLLWDRDKKELYPWEQPNMYHIDKSHCTKTYMVSDLIKHSIQTIDALDDHFNEYVDELQNCSDNFIKSENL